MSLRRNEFPVADRYAYFRHAAVSAMPRPTREVIGELTDDMVRNGCLNETDWRGRIREIRSLAASLLGTKSERIGFVTSTSHGLAWVAESLPLEDGDTVVVPDVEFPANRFPWENLQRKGVEFRMLETGDGTINASDLENQLSEDVAVFALSSVQFRSGFRSNLEALGSVCRDRGVHFVVDGIQSVGWDDLDLSELPVDVLVADAHKWMCGPEGVGLIYLDEAFQERLHPAFVGWQSVESPFDFESPSFDLKDDASVIEMGSYNTIGLLAMGASLELLHGTGLGTIRDHTLSLQRNLTGRLDQQGFEFAHEGWPIENQSPIVSLDHPELSTSDLNTEAEDAGIQFSVRGGRIRVALHLFNNERDLERLMDFLADQVSG